MAYIIANWKMNKTVKEALEYTDILEGFLSQHPKENIVICPPHICLPSLIQKKYRTFTLGIQNFYPEVAGSYTGEFSLSMLPKEDAPYVMIGHSERRSLCKEDNDLIQKKISFAGEQGYNIVFCIGESIEIQEKGMTAHYLKEQVDVLRALPHGYQNRLFIAYEPIWAIGTGRIPTCDEIEHTLASVDGYVKEILDNSKKNIYYLYGGSVTQHNVKSIVDIKHVHGVLVGSASLDINSFTSIIKSAQ